MSEPMVVDEFTGHTFDDGSGWVPDEPIVCENDDPADPANRGTLRGHRGSTDPRWVNDWPP